MTIDRQQTSFEGNERVDRPDFLGMLQNAFDDMRRLLQLVIDDSARRTVKRYQQGASTGLTLVIATDVERGFYDLTQEWVVKSPDAPGSTITLPMTPNTTNYVEVRVNRFTDNPQARAFWDVDIGLTGQEFFDTINVRTRIEEGFQSNTSGFSNGAVPVFIVVTDASNIVSVTPADDLLWKPRAFALPAATTRADVYNGISDLRSFIDYLGALMAESKGSGQTLDSAPWSSLKLLREYQGLFITSSPVVTFEGTFGSNQLNWTGDLLFDIAGRSGGQYRLAQATVTLNDGQALYVEIPETLPPANLTAVVTSIGGVPINPTAAGSSPRIFVLFIRRGSTVYGSMDLAPLDSGESDTVGQDLPVALRQRLGLTSETTFQAYTSTHIIAANDNYPAAISKLDAEAYAIQNNTPKEAYWLGDGVTTTFDLATATLSDGLFAWSTDNSQTDVIISVDGRGQRQDYTGGTGAQFRKLTTTSFQLTAAPDLGSIVKARKEGTSYGGAAAPSSGNLWSDPVDHDIVGPDLAYKLGTTAARFSEAHVDTLYASKVVLRESLGDASQIKSKVNGGASAIGAGQIISLWTDGNIYPADANLPQGQRFVGIALQTINPGMGGKCALYGLNIPGVLTALGFAPGDEVFVDNAGNYTTGSGLDGTSVIARVGWADCADGTGTPTVVDLIMSYQKIASP